METFNLAEYLTGGVEKHVRERRSVRTFDGRELTAEDKEKLYTFMQKIDM